MLKQVRQIAIMVRDMEASIQMFDNLFGMKPCKRRELTEYGMINAILPMNSTFIELLQPVDSSSAGARFLERYGEGVYMAIYETDNRDEVLEKARAMNLNITGVKDGPEFRFVWIHPRSMFGVFTHVEEVTGDNPWPDGGEEWQAAPKSPIIKDIKQVVFSVRDQKAALKQYEELLGLKATNFNDEMSQFGLIAAYCPVGNGDTFVEIIQPTDTEHSAGRLMERRGEGPYLLIFETYDQDAALERVKAAGVQITAVNDRPGFRIAWMHPRTTGGVFMQLSQATGENPWPPGGPEWYKGRG